MTKSSRAPETFGDRLKKARDLRSMSQGELAERARMQPAAISHFETGARKPSFDNLRRLAEALQVTSDYLLGRADDPEGHAATFDEPLFRDFKKVESETDRDSIRMLTDALLQRQEKGKKREV